MNLLLDSHVLVWSLAADLRLPSHISEAIEDGHNQLFVSTASLWELGIKLAQGRLRLPAGLESVLEFMRIWNVQLLPITLEHVRTASTLPFHHSDPFDRMLVAQAILEAMMLVTGDAHIHAYSVQIEHFSLRYSF